MDTLSPEAHCVFMSRGFDSALEHALMRTKSLDRMGAFIRYRVRKRGGRWCVYLPVGRIPE